MKYPYTAGKATQVAIVSLRLPNGVSIDAKLDTGAELCCIDQDYILGLSPAQARFIEQRQFSGMTGAGTFGVYFMGLQLHNRTFAVEVVAGRPGTRNVIGMNLLNEILSAFDGPNRHVELTL